MLNSRISLTPFALAAALLLSSCNSMNDLLDAATGVERPLAAKMAGEGAMAPDLARSSDGQVAGLYNAGLEQMSAGNYSTAAKKFAEVERLHPYSKWATKAQLLQSFASYQANKYADSIDAAQRFIALHPGHRDTDYAYYLIALSQYEQINDITRDQSQTKRALEALEEIGQRFPDSRYAADAKQKAVLARDHLAGKEMEIGRYYFRKKNWHGGINRFKAVVTNYQQTTQAPEALYRLAEGYMALGIRSEAQTAAAVLGHNFPRSSWYRDAYILVSGDTGVAPVENTSSWISKIFGN